MFSEDPFYATDGWANIHIAPDNHQYWNIDTYQNFALYSSFLSILLVIGKSYKKSLRKIALHCG